MRHTTRSQIIKRVTIFTVKTHVLAYIIAYFYNTKKTVNIIKIIYNYFSMIPKHYLQPNYVISTFFILSFFSALLFFFSISL